jgi:uroporphyrin-III C-methyltransferase/precorrin-2 dehydrogenase/sirohydrochlorin ferrochelatase
MCYNILGTHANAAKGAILLNARNREGPLYFPLFVELSGRRAIVVGGGLVAAKRAATLASFGASVKLVAPKLGHEAERLVRGGKAAWLRAGFASALLEGCDLAVAADRRDTNRAVAEAARAMCVLCSVEDSREESSFIFPTAKRLAQRFIGRYFGRKRT